MSARTGAWALGAAGLISTLACVPAVREAAKDQAFLWSPVSDWRPVVYVVPLVLAAIALAFSRGVVARVGATALFLVWAVLAVLQLLGGHDF